MAFHRSSSPGPLRPFLVSLAFGVAPAFGIVDTNNNGLSDLWEKQFNWGSLFPASFQAGDDTDGDGWTNAQEAEAGTNPKNIKPPYGIVRPAITFSPGNWPRISWPRVTGKHYQVEKWTSASDQWTLCSETIQISGNTCFSEIAPALDGQGRQMPMFLRVIIQDQDGDNDTLTDAEEAALGTRPDLADTDLDGLKDHEDNFPLANNVLADPDGQGLDASLDTGLIGRWDCESINTYPTGKGVGDSAPDGVVHNAVSDEDTLTIDTTGMISKGVRFNDWDDSLGAPGSLFSNRVSFSFSMWFQCESNTIQNRGALVNLVALNTQFSSYPPLMIMVQRAPSSVAPQTIIAAGYPAQSGGASIMWTGEMIAGLRLDDGRFHHFSLVKSGTTAAVYIDGNLAATGSVPNHYTSTANGYFSIGKAVPVAIPQTSTFLGSFDRMRFYSRALTGLEVKKLYGQDSDRDGQSDIVEINSGRNPALWGQ